MSYIRVLPRDLFNEAGLLKCLGKLWIAIENSKIAKIVEEHVSRFEIEMDDASGGIYAANLTFQVDGAQYRLIRPMNARRSWPLYIEALDNDDFDPIDVFNEDGTLTVEAGRFLGA